MSSRRVIAGVCDSPPAVRLCAKRFSQTQPMRALALAAITAYQRYISPYKGFCCAYRVHTGHASCSALGYRAIRRHGLFKGLGLIRLRMQLCGVAHRRYGQVLPRPLAAQRGDCDVGGCDMACHGDCDLPGGKVLSKVCDAVSCCDVASCDWPGRKDKQRQRREAAWRSARAERVQRQGAGVLAHVHRPIAHQGLEARPIAREQRPRGLFEAAQVAGHDRHEAVGRLA